MPLASLWTALMGTAEVETLAGELWLPLLTAIAHLIYEAKLSRGLVLSHSILPHPPPHLEVWTFTARPHLLLPRQDFSVLGEVVAIPHAPDDFWVILSDEFHLVAVLSPDEKSCVLSWHPQSVATILQVLAIWLEPAQKTRFTQQVSQYPLALPSYQWLCRFSHLALQQAVWADPPDLLTDCQPISAIAHEVKTTLATIRTLSRSLLKRKDISPETGDRLHLIEQECLSQIARFELLLQALQFQESCQAIPRQATAISTLLDRNLSQWQAQAEYRQISLTVDPLREIPLIFTNPQLLEQVINGLVDHLTRTSPSQTAIYVQITLAGNYLKWQFQVFTVHSLPSPQAVGDWLICQPDTGVVSLSIPTVKSLLQTLGGRLTMRSHLLGVSLSIFLPLCESL